VLVPLLERIGALGPLRARLRPAGAELLDRLVAARG
jgi:hypothetical protein